MADPPRYPDSPGDTGLGAGPEPSPGPSSRSKLPWIAVGVTLVVLMVGLHLAGVTPH